MRSGIISEEKKYIRWLIAFGAALIIISIVLYVLHYYIFRDAQHIFIFLVKDIAFLPIKVLFITIIVHHILGSREKRIRLEKMNMLISVFFSEAGTKLLDIFAKSDNQVEHIRNLTYSCNWSDKDLSMAQNYLQNYTPEINVDNIDIENLKEFLIQKRDSLFHHLENPYLLEHESFTELLRAVSHLAEELFYRENVKQLSEKDYAHLAGDIERAYVLLIREWFSYMCYLNNSYPYLFSLALRLNPFEPESSVEVK